MENRPTAAELVTAVADWLRADAMPALTGAAAFQARVAANALGIVARELEAGPALFDDDRAALRSLLDDPPVGDADLLREVGARIRDGALDDRSAELLPALRSLARHKLSVDNPRHLSDQHRAEVGR